MLKCLILENNEIKKEKEGKKGKDIRKYDKRENKEC